MLLPAGNVCPVSAGPLYVCGGGASRALAVQEPTVRVGELVVCPICHEIDTTPEFPEARGPASTYPVVRCRRCSLVVQARIPAPEIEPADTAASAPPQNRFGGPLELAIRLFRSARVRRAVRLMPPGGRTLDIGCGRGQYLNMLQERGYRVRGTEHSKETARGIEPDVPVDYGDVTPGRYADASFDLISIWHVLEHLYTPDVTLAACAEALEPGGALMIAVPNYGSVQARFGGEQWLHLDLPRHVFQFTEPTLRRLLEQHGFRIEQWRTGQWEMDPFGLLQTFLNRLGLRHNALFDTLRRDPGVKDDLSLPYRALMLLAFVLGMPVATVVSLVLRVFRRAGTLIVVARKPQSAEGAVT